MARITQTETLENNLSSTIEAFFHTFRFPNLLKRVGVRKTKGVPAVKLFQALCSMAFHHRTMFRELTSLGLYETGKDTFYRFINSCHINWMRFTTLLASKIVNERIAALTGTDRVNVFIVDDTPYERNRSKKVELLSRVYDHCSKKYIRGFRFLTLGFSDGNTFVPVNSCLLASADTKKLLHGARSIDKRSCGYRQRRLAQATAPVAMLEMIRQAMTSGLYASYALFDSWFSFTSNILALKRYGLDVIARVKNTTKAHYRYQGTMLSVPEIYKRNRKRRGRSRYLLSVAIEVCNADMTETTRAKLVYVRNRNKKKDYVTLISTDTSLSEEEIIRIYGKRWDIEVFFKVCKSYLRLTQECSSLSYDAMTAYTAVVFVRYVILALENRMQKDERTLGALFYGTCDELSDITFTKSFLLLMKTFLDKVTEKLFLEEYELELLIEEFISELPSTLKTKLLFMV